MARRRPSTSGTHEGEVVADVAEINADGTGTALLTDLTFTWEMNADGGPEEEGLILHS